MLIQTEIVEKKTLYANDDVRLYQSSMTKTKEKIGKKSTFSCVSQVKVELYKISFQLT